MMRRSWALVPLLPLVAACGSILGYGDFQKVEESTSATGDGGTATASGSATSGSSASGSGSSATTTTTDAGTSCASSTPFGTPRSLGANVNSTAFETSPTLSPDELTIYFERSNQNGSRGSIMTATRASVSADFGAATEATALGSGNAFTPGLSRDGLTMVYSSFVSSMDLLVATRATVTGTFGGIRALAQVDDDGASDVLPVFAGNGELFFASDRGTSPLRNQVWRATASGGDFVGPTLVSELAGAVGGDVFGLAVSPDGLTLYLGTRMNGAAEEDVFKATRASVGSAFGAPVAVTEVNSPSADSVPGWVSPDNCRLYMMSARGGSADLYVATRAR